MASRTRRKREINPYIGPRIRQLRELRNMTQRELAERLHKSESTVRMWELGKSSPRIDMVLKIAVFFRVTMNYLCGVSDKPREWF